MTALQKMRVTLDHGIYGKPEVDAWVSEGGLCVHKQTGLRPRWIVSHTGRGLAVSDGDPRRTKAGAIAQMEALLATPVDWRQDGQSVARMMRENESAVRLALGTARDK